MRQLSGRLFLFLVGSALLFLATDLYTELRAAEIDRRSAEIRANALPSVDLLVDVDGALHAAESAVQGRGRGTPSARDRVIRAAAIVQSRLDAYRSLPRYPGEQDVQERLTNAVTAFRMAVSRFLAADDASPRADVLLAIGSAVDDASAQCREAIRFNLRAAFASIQRISGVRSSLRRAGLFLDGAVAFFTMCLGVLGARAVRRAERLSRAHERVLEERARELELFGERLAHDLRSPLGTIGLALNLIKQLAGEPSDRFTTTLERAERATDRAALLIEHMYGFSKAAGQAEPGAHADLVAVVNDVVEQVRESPEADGFDIQVEPFGPYTVACEAGALTSIVDNLLRNAVKYSRACPVRRVVVRASSSRGMVHVDVDDTGPGIADELVDKLFQPHVRAPGTKEVGLGLGLATVKRFCEARGGTVGARAKSPGPGSVFWFELPIF